MSGNRYTVLLSAAIVEELDQFQLFHNSSRQQYSVTVTGCCSYSCFVLLKMGDSDARNMQSSCQINPLNAELNTICHLLALLGAHHILHISRIRVK